MKEIVFGEISSLPNLPELVLAIGSNLDMPEKLLVSFSLGAGWAYSARQTSKSFEGTYDKPWERALSAFGLILVTGVNVAANFALYTQ